MDLNEVWSIMHPKIIELSKPRIESGQYADAVSAAFRQIELSVRKTFVEKGGDGKEFGVDLMRKAFDIRDEKPILEFKSSSECSDGSIQRGYEHMFEGSMMAIRNPKAHENDDIALEDALRKLAFASMLMYKLDTVK